MSELLPPGTYRFLGPDFCLEECRTWADVPKQLAMLLDYNNRIIEQINAAGGRIIRIRLLELTNDLGITYSSDGTICCFGIYYQSKRELSREELRILL